ncbi:MAG TPA: DUF1269 domain-containing protein [Anaerolineae bacterium]|nr:DUF1269 domain-containing protein [Anaerolineae bacterium]
MANLVVVLYDDQFRAKEVMKELKTLKENKQLEVDDAAYVSKDNAGHFHIHQEHSLTKSGAVAGGLGGVVAGLLFTIPVAGLAVGAAAGAIAGKAQDYGIDDKMIKAINDDMRLNTSAIFLLVHDVNRDAVLPIFTKYGGKVMQTTVSAEDEAKLQAMLDEANKTTWKDAR